MLDDFSCQDPDLVHNTRMKELIRKLFRPAYKSIYGPQIFDQQTWLDKKVNEQLLKRQLEIDVIRK
jgi:hypothetical protein